MSKSFADIAAMIAPSNNTLFDRYVNVTLSEKPFVEVPRTNRVSDVLEAMAYNKNVFSIRTPPFGQKPNITVSGNLTAQDTVHSITVTIYNMDATIDFNRYRYIDIELGYMKSGFATRFKGEIINIYMAKPNPNGELVITCASAQLTNAVTVSNFKLYFATDTYTFDSFLATVSSQIGINIKYNEIPEQWKAQTFTVNKATYQFNSVMSVITWLNSLFIALAEHSVTDLSTDGLTSISAGGNILSAAQKGLPPIFAHIEDYEIIIKGSYSKSALPTLKALSNIGNAYISGDSAGTVTAPFNPDIYVGDYLYINPAYFKTRVAANIGFNKGSMTSVWCVINMQFTFSTYTSNTMTLLVNNVQDKIFLQ